MAMQNPAVLIADDNELNRWLLSEQIQQWTKAITLAQDGREAWQFIETEKYALIFLDMNMPYLNGLELIEKLRQEETPNRSTPAVAVTAHAQNQLHQTFAAAGFNACLIKPILLQHLKPLIERWLSDDRTNPEYYAAQIAKKTEFNLEISRSLLNRLFDEVPEYFQGVAQALHVTDYDRAWQIAHKLQGALCFYGFEDFLLLAEDLERHLANQDGTSAYKQLDSIRERFATLTTHKETILLRVMEQAARDFNTSR